MCLRHWRGRGPQQDLPQTSRGSFLRTKHSYESDGITDRVPALFFGSFCHTPASSGSALWPWQHTHSPSAASGPHQPPRVKNPLSEEESARGCEAKKAGNENAHPVRDGRFTACRSAPQPLTRKPRSSSRLYVSGAVASMVAAVFVPMHFTARSSPFAAWNVAPKTFSWCLLT